MVDCSNLSSASPLFFFSSVESYRTQNPIRQKRRRPFLLCCFSFEVKKSVRCVSATHSLAARLNDSAQNKHRASAPDDTSKAGETSSEARHFCSRCSACGCIRTQISHKCARHENVAISTQDRLKVCFSFMTRVTYSDLLVNETMRKSGVSLHPATYLQIAAAADSS